MAYGVLGTFQAIPSFLRFPLAGYPLPDLDKQLWAEATRASAMWTEAFWNPKIPASDHENKVFMFVCRDIIWVLHVI